MQKTRVTSSWAASGTNTGTHGIPHGISMPTGQPHTDGLICLLERTSNVAVDPNSLTSVSAVISRTATTSGSVALTVETGLPVVSQ